MTQNICLLLFNASLKMSEFQLSLFFYLNVAARNLLDNYGWMSKNKSDTAFLESVSAVSPPIQAAEG